MDSLQKEKLRNYFLEKLPERVNVEEAFDLLLLIIEEKPGVLVMGADRSTVKLLQEFAEDFDLKVKIIKGEKRSIGDRILGRDTRFKKDGVFITKDKDRFNLLENSTGDFLGFSDRAVGEFLGYPEKSRNYYAGKSGEELARTSIEGKMTELKEKGEIREGDEKYLELVSYRPEPEKESILKAIDRGKEREEKLRELDTDLGVSVGEKYLDEIQLY